MDHRRAMPSLIKVNLKEMTSFLAFLAKRIQVVNESENCTWQVVKQIKVVKESEICTKQVVKVAKPGSFDEMNTGSK